jgi:hypothetical protein
MSDIMEITGTTGISLKVKHKLWIADKKKADKNFTFSRFVQEIIDLEITKEANNGATRDNQLSEKE